MKHKPTIRPDRVKIVSVRTTKELFAKAKELNINLSQTLHQALTEIVADMIRAKRK